ncbi:MAG TPA: LytTR family DNA-binding domain-containing protein [Thermoanaerobaculia bacterium]|nr:LytTR family DNA-binding domain-containing protein [Thermoanaerobaculia bacterium]
MRRYGRKHADVEIVAECRDAEELQRTLETTEADVLLLDVRMPGPDVFSILDGRDALPLVIFATAYDGYALRAFEVNAVDYLLKPFSEERFAAAIEKARQRRGGGNANLARLLRDLGPRPDRILVPHRDSLVPVAVSDIIWIKAEGDYARIHTRGRSYLIARTLNELEEKLDPMQFLRIHRSAIIRTDKIREVTGEGSARYRVVLEDASTLIVSRSRAPQLKRWML